MELTPMQFKGFIWPHNPKTYTIRYERRVALHDIPFGGYVLQALGLTRRIMEGEGEFYGKGAYDSFKKLASIFYQGGAGTLIHPLWQSTRAYLVRLTLKQEPRADYVRYTFTFWEDVQRETETSETTSISVQSETQYHVVLPGETLWSVAQTYGVTLTELLRLNSEIKNPNLVTAGTSLRVR